MSRHTMLSPLSAAVYRPRMEYSKVPETSHQSAVNAQLLIRAMSYSYVNLLMICFEDDLGCLEELTSFHEKELKDYD